MFPAFVRFAVFSPVLLGLIAIAGSACAPLHARPEAGQAQRATSIGLAPTAESHRLALSRFSQKVQGLNSGFSGAAALDRALLDVAVLSPRALEAGVISEAAAAALGDARFVAAVRAEAARQKDLGRRLAADPSRIYAVAGADRAAARAASALRSRAGELQGAGGRLKRLSYDVQRASWSKGRASDPRGRLSRIKAAGGGVGSPDGRMQPPGAARDSVVTRGLALAALSVLGDERGSGTLLRGSGAGQCLRLARLNYHQCLSSSGAYYEDIYCLGVHALAETGACMTPRSSGPSKRRALL